MKNRLTAIVAILAMTFSVAPVSFAAAAPLQAGQTGTVRGEVRERCGQALPAALVARLVDGQGAAVAGMTTPVGPTGAFTFSNVAPGGYTVQIMGGTTSALGMTAVAVTPGQSSTANVTVGNTQCGGWNKTTKLIIASALVAGVIVVVATASPSK